MAVVKVNEVPVPKPPMTYDILGLSEDEMKLIVSLVGRSGGDLAYRLFNALPFVLFDSNYFHEKALVLTPKNGK
jgi:hypothetical protein